MAALIHVLAAVNAAVLAAGRSVAWLAMGLMVVVILVQVFCRYILNSALPWPDEAARFLMLWMSCLIAPTAYRRGGFVSINIIKDWLGQRVGAVLALGLLLLSLSVLLIGVKLGLAHVQTGMIFNSSSLKVPLSLIGLQTLPIKLAWMYASMFTGVLLLVMVSIELILRQVAELCNVGGLPPIAEQVIAIE